MKRADVAVGMTVYHTTFDHWLGGEVTALRSKDNLGYPTARRVKVKWAGLGGKENWFRLSELRRTPK